MRAVQRCRWAGGSSGECSQHEGLQTVYTARRVGFPCRRAGGSSSSCSAEECVQQSISGCTRKGSCKQGQRAEGALEVAMALVN